MPWDRHLPVKELLEDLASLSTPVDIPSQCATSWMLEAYPTRPAVDLFGGVADHEPLGRRCGGQSFHLIGERFRGLARNYHTHCSA